MIKSIIYIYIIKRLYTLIVPFGMHRKDIKHPETIGRGMRKIYLTRMLTLSEPESVCSSTSSSSSPLPWWKKYFGCFSRRRQSNNSSAVNTGGGRKYKQIKNRTKRYRRK
jgi:hypothetical protein